ncbi:MAG: threonine synthase [Pseudomonadota bacterium]
MRYISTRGQAPVLSFEEVMLTGLARDGGLYVPEVVPTLTDADFTALKTASYEEAAFIVMKPYIGDCFTDAEFREIIAAAYAGFGHPTRCPMVQLGPNDWLLELHRGPTLAFKDVALQLIGQMFDKVLSRRGERVCIVGATSGDTGSAAMEAFRGSSAVDVFFLHPHNRISEVQRRQMTTPVEPNVHAIALEGTFDDCQARVKDMFNDFGFRDEIGLAAANSINWARVLAQVVYYVTAAVAVGAPGRAVSFSVPTGNFGDIYAGQIARRMGVPVDTLIIATNENDILHRTMETGAYETAGVHPTISPSMDIQVSSNFERLLFELYDQDGGAVAQLMGELNEAGRFTLSQGALERLREGFASARADKAAAMAEILHWSDNAGMVLDPHTVIGIAAAREVRGDAATPMICLATAHAAKFPDAVEEACGIRPDLPHRMADLYERDERMVVLPNDLAVLEDHIRKERRQ